MGPFVSQKQNEVLWIPLQEPTLIGAPEVLHLGRFLPYRRTLGVFDKHPSFFNDGEKKFYDTDLRMKKAAAQPYSEFQSIFSLARKVSTKGQIL